MNCRWWMGILGCVAWLVGGGCRPSDKILLDDAENPHVVTGLDSVRALDFDHAIQAFEKALEVNPNSVRAHYELGVIQERQKRDYITALYHYNRVLQLQKEGWPVENVQLLVEGCRQELIKAEALAPIAYAMQRELEELRKENKRLQKEINDLKSPSRIMPVPAGTTPKPELSPTPPPGRSTPAAPLLTPPATAGAQQLAQTAGVRYHRVRNGETLAAISRLYRIDLNALVAANRHINPRTMAVGQLIRIPAP